MPPKLLSATMARARQRGVTLVELMISMVIGLVIIGALVALYANSVGANKVSAAQSEMNEDAQFAMNIITSQLRQAGYNPVNAGQTKTFVLPSVHAVFGCSAGFSNATSATSTIALTCNSANPAASGAIAIAYEADVYNTIPSGASPTNCVGAALTAQTDEGTGANFYPVENRYYVKTGTVNGSQVGTLYCAGVSGVPGVRVVGEQALVDNVERIEFSYGSTTVTTANFTTTGAITGYLSADELGPAIGVATSPAHANFVLAGRLAEEIWKTVVAVRVCVIMRSSAPVFEENVTSYGCDASVYKSDDKYLRRAYVSTVLLRNKVPMR